MRKMLLGSILMCGLFAVAADGLVGPGSVDNTTGAVPTRDTLLVDTRVGVDPPAFAVVSSSFSDLGGYENMGADDFTVSDCGWEINTIRAYGNYSNQIDPGAAGPATSVNVWILPKTGSLPTSTDVGSIAIWSGEDLPYTELDAVDGGDFEISIPGLVLPGGDYWIVVQANMAFFSNGQWNWTESSLTPNSGTTNGDESAWFQSGNGVQSPISGDFECVGAWNSRVTGCQMTRDPDTNPPADRDFVFQIEGNVLTPGVTASTAAINTTEDGSAVVYTVVLDAPPSDGATVTVTPSSTDVTEGTVSAALNFTSANWDVPQNVTVTPGASGDGNDGDVAFSIDHAVSSTVVAGCYDGVMAGSIAVTNNNIDGVATILVDPASGLTVSEDGVTTATFTVSAAPDITPSADVTVNLTNNSPTEVSLSAASAVLTAGNSYSVTITVTGVADDVVESTQAFSITTEPSTSGDAAYNGVNPTDVSGNVTDSNTASVTVTPANTPLATDETGTTDSIDYVLTAEPTADVTFTLSSDDPNEAMVAPNTLTFTMANWDTPQTVTVTGQDDDVDDAVTAYNIIASNTSSADPFWQGVPVGSAAGQNSDDADTAGVTVNPTSGLTTTEAGGTDTFTVVLDTEPIADVVINVSTSDDTEGLIADDGVTFVTSLDLTFDNSNWNVAQTITIQGQDDNVRADGDIAYTVTVASATSDDTNYDGQAGAAVSVTNTDDDGAVGITVSETTLTFDEDGADQTFTVVLDTEPTADVNIPISSGDTSEATVDVASLDFTTVNWNTPQTVTVSPVEDFIVDGDETFDITIGPATGGNYAGLSETVSVTVNNVDVCGPMTLEGSVGETLVATGTPGCVFDLYETGGDPDPMNWTFLGTFTVPVSGTIDTGVVAEEDSMYVTSNGGVVLSGSPLVTVPTLGEWGLIFMITLLAGAGIVMKRRTIA